MKKPENQMIIYPALGEILLYIYKKMLFWLSDFNFDQIIYVLKETQCILKAHFLDGN